jgi:phage-related protein
MYETQFLLGAKIQSSLNRGFGTVQRNLGMLQRQATLSQRALSGMATGSKRLFGLAAAYIGISSITNFLKANSEEAKASIVNETKLITVLKERTKATKEQMQAIFKLTLQQQRLGVIEDDTQVAGAQQIATFIHQTKSLETLIPAMNNLIAQKKGLNATEEDAVNIGNLMGKVLDGQTGALRRVGISFSKAEERVLKYGNEAQRAAMLAKVINQNVGQMNMSLAQTDEGKLAKSRIELANLQEEIGKRMIPLQVKFAEMFLKALPYIERLLPLLDKIPVVMDIIASELGHSEAIQYIIKNVLPALGAAFKSWMPTIVDIVKNTWSLIQSILKLLGPVIMAIMPIVQSLVGNLLIVLNGLIKFLDGVFSGNWKKCWEGIADILTGVFKLAINGLFGTINLMIEQINKIKLPDWIPGVGGKGLNITPFKMLANGTPNWKGGLAIAGERGPELMNLPSGTQVYPHNRTESLLNSLSGGLSGGISLQITQIFNGPADKEAVKQANKESAAEFEQKLNAALFRRQRLSFGG